MVFSVAMAVVGSSAMADHHEEKKAFSSQTIDLGVVVSDIDRSAKFYKEALGFKEVPGFDVPGDWANKVGLSDGSKLSVRVFVLGAGEAATKLKLMQFPDVRSKRTDNRYIHSQLGFSYLTLHITDTTAALARLAKAKIKPIAGGTRELPKPLPQGVYLTIVRDPDGNLIELVGPRG